MWEQRQLFHLSSALHSEFENVPLAKMLLLQMLQGGFFGLWEARMFCSSPSPVQLKVVLICIEVASGT